MLPINSYFNHFLSPSLQHCTLYTCVFVLMNYNFCPDVFLCAASLVKNRFRDSLYEYSVTNVVASVNMDSFAHSQVYT